MKFGAKYYRTARGDEPVREYLDGISTTDAAAVYAALDMLCRIGWLEMPHGRALAGHKGLYEIRHRHHRVLYAIDNGDVVLLHAFRKQGRKTPKGDLETAVKRMKSLS